MSFFNHCTCGHIEEDHATDAPEGEQECMNRGDDGDTPCTCKDFQYDGV